MIFKWGSGLQSRYKQKANTNEFEDAYIVETSLVPLQLYGYNEMNQKIILWQNSRTSSTSYCRPIRFRFAKETEQLILEEFESVRNQITTILPTRVEFNGQILEVTASNHIIKATRKEYNNCYSSCCYEFDSAAKYPNSI